MATNADHLYELLPAVYREHDAANGYSLKALLSIIAEQAMIVENDIHGLWENLFIETCKPWVIPYIGDLVSNDLLYDTTRMEGKDTAAELFTDLSSKDLRPLIAARIRADVAKTIYYRRRKGTLPMLEELARDVTGWPAHAVEFLELLGWTQHLEHIRPQSRWTDIRSIDRMDRVDGAFDETSHTADVRRIAQLEGWHNIRNIGFFLWRIKSYPLENVPARQADKPWRHHFSPLGNPAPLFSRWRREGDEAGLATEFHVPAPIRRAFFHQDLTRPRALAAHFTDLYGLFDLETEIPVDLCPDCSFFILCNEQPVLPSQVVCRRLDPWPENQPSGKVVLVDVERGRIAIGDDWTDTSNVDVWYHYGFSADLGGGPYDRRKWLVRPEPDQRRYGVKEGGIPGQGQVTHTSLIAALTDWESAGRPNAVITILDSRTYTLPATVTLRNEGWLVIEAADRERPVLQTDPAGLDVDVLPAQQPGDPDRRGALTLSGVVVEGSVHVTGDLGRLRLLHATLVPGRHLTESGDPESRDPSLTVEGGTDTDRLNAHLRIEMAFSISGPLIVPSHASSVCVLDSIVDGLADDAASATAIGKPDDGPGPPLTIERATILGSVQAKTLEASESIFTGTVDAGRTQEGCVRFSYVPPQSRTPRRYRCQPDLAVETAIKEALERNPGLPQSEQDKIRDQIREHIQGWLAPSFTARLYGQPEYAQLHLGCPLEIRTGAADGAEMGAFSHLKQPQRESNLKIRLQEYLPFGLEAGIIYVT